MDAENGQVLKRQKVDKHHVTDEKAAAQKPLSDKTLSLDEENDDLTSHLESENGLRDTSIHSKVPGEGVIGKRKRGRQKI